jgi:hypothetical protein
MIAWCKPDELYRHTCILTPKFHRPR